MNEENEKTNTNIIDTEEKENLKEKIVVNYLNKLKRGSQDEKKS